MAGGEFAGGSKWTGWVTKQPESVTAVAKENLVIKATQVPLA